MAFSIPRGSQTQHWPSMTQPRGSMSSVVWPGRWVEFSVSCRQQWWSHSSWPLKPPPMCWVGWGTRFTQTHARKNLRNGGRASSSSSFPVSRKPWGGGSSTQWWRGVFLSEWFRKREHLIPAIYSGVDTVEAVCFVAVSCDSACHLTSSLSVPSWLSALSDLV